MEKEEKRAEGREEGDGGGPEDGGGPQTLTLEETEGTVKDGTERRETGRRPRREGEGPDGGGDGEQGPKRQHVEGPRQEHADAGPGKKDCSEAEA